MSLSPNGNDTRVNATALAAIMGAPEFTELSNSWTLSRVSPELSKVTSFRLVTPSEFVPPDMLSNESNDELRTSEGIEIVLSTVTDREPEGVVPPALVDVTEIEWTPPVNVTSKL